MKRRYWLADLRQKAGYTQASFAKEIGMDRGGYGKIENGKTAPKLKTAITISRKLDFDISRFLEE